MEVNIKKNKQVTNAQINTGRRFSKTRQSFNQK